MFNACIAEILVYLAIVIMTQDLNMFTQLELCLV